MKKLLLLFAAGVLGSLSLFGQVNPAQKTDVDGGLYITQSSTSETISLYVRQNDFSRIAVSASKPVPQPVYITVVVWHAPPGVWGEDEGMDVATLSIVLTPGQMNASEILYVGGEPAYIIGGVYSASAYSTKLNC